MEFRLLPDALEVQESERWVKIGGHIKVLARTRSNRRTHQGPRSNPLFGSKT